MSARTGTGSVQTTPPIFSVLMAAFGTEQYIADAVRSVIGQSRSDWELIVVDDGSPDKLAEAVRPFLSDPRVRLIRQENLGLGATLNVAASSAKGRYLVKLDSDDLLQPEYLAVVAETLDSRPDIGVVSCDALVLEANGSIRPTTYLEGRSSYDSRVANVSLRRLLRENVVYAGATLRRHVLEDNGGFDSDPAIVEDWDLWIRLAAAGVGIEIIPRPLAIYRMRANSLSRDDGGANRLWPRIERTLHKARSELTLSPAEDRAAAAALARYGRDHFLGRARHQLWEGRSGAARRSALDAARRGRSLRALAIALVLAIWPGLLRRHISADATASRASRFTRTARRGER